MSNVLKPGEPIHFYFDYLSPYAYFAWRNLPPLADKYDRKIEAHPVVFGKLLDKWGQLGPAEISPKRKWLHEYCLRYAALHGFEYNRPKSHPFNPLSSLRMSLREVSGNDQHRIIDAIFEAGWTQGQELGDLSSLEAIVEQQGIDAKHLSQQVSQPEVKQLLINETAMAIEKGVFGVPTIIIGDNLFWGNDQMEHIELLLSGNDPLDREKLNAQVERPRGIDRKAFIKLNARE